MKFKSIAARIFFSIAPIIIISTIVFIGVIYSVTYKQSANETNEKMYEILRTARMSIHHELANNADTALHMAIYAEIDKDLVTNKSELEDFVRESVHVYPNTVGGGLWYEPYALDSSKKHFSTYAYQDNGTFYVTFLYDQFADYFAQPWYIAGKSSTDSVAWSGLYFDPLAKETMISAAKSFYDSSGNLQGVATADMSLSVIRRIIDNVAIGQTGRAFLVGENGEYVSFLDDSRSIEMYIQNDPDPSLAALGQEILANRSGMTQCTYNGVSQSVYYMTLSEVNWTLVALVETSEIVSSTMSLVWVMGIVPVLGLIIAVIAILFVARYLRKVTYKVNSFADQAASGNLSPRLEITETDEFGFMEDRLNRMIANMGVMQAHSDEMLSVAQKASKAKSEFLSRMSHEIRTPMNAIMGMTQIASATEDMEKIKNCIQKTNTAAQQLLSMVNDVLDMSKIEEGKLILYEDAFDLRATIQDVCGVLEVKAYEKKQRFRVALSPGLPMQIVSDEMRLSQVITNLLSNAVKFTPEGGRITLMADSKPQGNHAILLSIRVSDTGIGIAKESIDSLFLPFEQGDGSTSRKYGGSGLGLAICKSIADLMQGTITVQSQINQGSVFTFTVPVKLGNAAENQGRLNAKVQIPDWAGKRLLLCEDVDINAEIACALLEESHIEIVHVKDGLEAVQRFNDDSQGFDLILMDIQMPCMDGLHATRAIRQTPKGQKVPIIAMTANAFKEDVAQSLEAGMNGHIPKPIDYKMLINTLAVHLGK